MGQIKAHAPVKLICGVITAIPDQLEAAHQRLSEQFGEIDFISEILPFDYTDYYEPEMGKNLKRQFVSFAPLIAPEELASAKRLSNEIEAKLGVDMSVLRPVNLDPGYVSAAKLVLASTKDHAHRIYLRDGVYAEITLRYYQKTFRPWDWTYPDYRTPAYIEIFNRIRRIYLEQLRERGLPAHL
jgi:hypothetical protein